MSWEKEKAQSQGTRQRSNKDNAAICPNCIDIGWFDFHKMFCEDAHFVNFVQAGLHVAV